MQDNVNAAIKSGFDAAREEQEKAALAQIAKEQAEKQRKRDLRQAASGVLTGLETLKNLPGSKVAFDVNDEYHYLRIGTNIPLFNGSSEKLVLRIARDGAVESYNGFGDKVIVVPAGEDAQVVALAAKKAALGGLVQETAPNNANADIQAAIQAGISAAQDQQRKEKEAEEAKQREREERRRAVDAAGKDVVKGLEKLSQRKGSKVTFTTERGYDDFVINTNIRTGRFSSEMVIVADIDGTIESRRSRFGSVLISVKDGDADAIIAHATKAAILDGLYRAPKTQDADKAIQAGIDAAKAQRKAEGLAKAAATRKEKKRVKDIFNAASGVLEGLDALGRKRGSKVKYTTELSYDSLRITTNIPVTRGIFKDDLLIEANLDGSIVSRRGSFYSGELLATKDAASSIAHATEAAVLGGRYRVLKTEDDGKEPSEADKAIQTGVDAAQAVRKQRVADKKAKQRKEKKRLKEVFNAASGVVKGLEALQALPGSKVAFEVKDDRYYDGLRLTTNIPASGYHEKEQLEIQTRREGPTTVWTNWSSTPLLEAAQGDDAKVIAFVAKRAALSGRIKAPKV